MRSALSRSQVFQRAKLRMVSAKFSHTQLVQLAAVTPPLAHVLEHAAAEIGDVEAVDDDQLVVELGHLARPSLGLARRSCAASRSVAELRGQGKGRAASDGIVDASLLAADTAGRGAHGPPGLGAAMALARAEGRLRRRHRRRRRAWARHRLLPRQGARAHQHRRAGEGLDRRRQHRAATPPSSAPTTCRTRAPPSTSTP